MTSQDPCPLDRWAFNLKVSCSVRKFTFPGLLDGTYNPARVREKFSYPLVLWTSTILNLVVRNPRVLVQKVLLKIRVFNDFLIIHLLLCKHPRFFLFLVALKEKLTMKTVICGLLWILPFTNLHFEPRNELHHNRSNSVVIIIWSQYSTVSVFFCE